MLILGGRYGSIEEDSGLSYTELEYKYALSKNMPVFAIILEDSFLFTKAASYGKNAIFEQDNIEKYDAFKSLVMSKIIKKIQNINSIKAIVHSTINAIQYDDEYSLVGWIKGTTINNDPKITNRIKFLETENINLKSQLSTPNNKILGRFTTSELISILSSINLNEKIINLFDFDENDDFSFLSKHGILPTQCLRLFLFYF